MINRKLLLLRVMLCTSLPFGIAAELYKNRKAYIASNVITTGLCLGAGLLTYKASGPLVKQLISDETSMASPTLLRLMGAATISLAIGALTGKTITQGLYMSLAKQQLVPSITEELLKKLEEYALYVLSLEAVDKDLNELIESLDAQKYHQTRLPERLVCLDGAFYHLKEHDLMAKLRKECDDHHVLIQKRIKELQFFIDPEDQSWQSFKELMDDFQKNSARNPGKSRAKVLQAMQQQNNVKLYRPFTDLHIHIKLFLKGFNQGVNIIDEAMQINAKTREFGHMVSSYLYALNEKIKALLLECHRLKKLEKTVANFSGNQLFTK